MAGQAMKRRRTGIPQQNESQHDRARKEAMPITKAIKQEAQLSLKRARA